jgi:citrate lyase subunit beta/citryl-CoA lyase
MPIIESELGVENAFLLASASPKVCSLAIGLEDYTADLGVVKTESGAESLYARARIVNAARAAGVQASDSAYGNIGDREGLTNWALAARALGFDGMGCVHPLQVEPIHAAFAPSVQEVEKAQQIVDAFQAATDNGSGVIALGSKMIDRPVVNRALKVLETARKMGLMTKQGEEASAAMESGGVKHGSNGH